MEGFLHVAANAKILTADFDGFILDQRGPVTYNAGRVMSQSLYRHYYYYGPLSGGRDGQAMGCRRAMTS